jgi:hypothetical protein
MVIFTVQYLNIIIILMKVPKIPSLNKVKTYFKKNGLNFILKNIDLEEKNIFDKRFSKKIYSPDIRDLYRLHKLIIDNKRTKALEYGTGWSSLIIYHALKYNEKKYKKNLFPRIKNPYNLTIVDNDKKFLKISKERIDNFFKKKTNINFHFSKNKMTTFNGRITSEFINHPQINPDFIYLDGPDQFKISGRVNNLTIATFDFMPMSSDILKYENFLTPGTIIIIDGRTVNARFLKNNFQRKWKYFYDLKNEQSIFYLNEGPLGKLNKIQLQFYKK